MAVYIIEDGFRSLSAELMQCFPFVMILALVYTSIKKKRNKGIDCPSNMRTYAYQRVVFFLKEYSQMQEMF